MRTAKTKPRSTSGVAKVIKVVPKAAAKKERGSSRPPAAVVRAPVVARIEPARISGSEHGAAISRTDHLKARFAALSSAMSHIKSLKRNLAKTFFEVGSNLNQIREAKLYEVKGYGSFESFVEREIDLDKTMCARLARVSTTMVREAALSVGLDRACAAMAVLDGEPSVPGPIAVYPVNATVSSTLPAHKR